MKILITGATGFIGAHLFKALTAEGYRCRCLVRRVSDVRELEALGAELFFGDIVERGSLTGAAEGVDIVYHLAAQVGGWGIPEEVFYKVNVTGTVNLLEEAVRARVKHFIHCSTPGVLGLGKRKAVESLDYNPRGAYERTKCEAERMVLRYHEMYSLPATVIRPDLVYGPGDLRRAEFFRRIAEKRFIIVGNGKSVLHPTYVDDLVRGFILALPPRRGTNMSIYNIAGPSQVTVEEFIHTIAECLGVEVPKLRMPRAIAKLGAGAVEMLCKALGRKPPVTSSMIDFLTLDHSSDISKAGRELGYIPRISLRDGMKQTIEWYKAQNLL